MLDQDSENKTKGVIIDKTKKILKDFIDSRNPNYDRISITTFRGPGYYVSNDPRNYPECIKTIHEMDNNFANAKATVDTMEFGGLTPLLDGLSKSKSNLDVSGSTANRKILIILGDGHPNVGPERDHYYKNMFGTYYGEHPNYYPGDDIKNQINILVEKYNNDAISLDEYDEQSSELKKQQKLYPGATKKMFIDSNDAQTQRDLKGTIYDNSKAEFYDLRYLVMEEVKKIKNAGYEVFSVFLNNEKPEIRGYKDFLANTNEAEKLFKEIAEDDKHYFYSENITDLPQAFEDVKKNINTFDYFVNDTIEDGFELMPNTLEASRDDVIPSVNGKNITWDVSGVPYNNLQVSYHIKRENQSGRLKIRYVDEANGNDIIDPILSTEPLNQAYTTKKKVLPGYEYVRVVGAEKGKYVSGTSEVIYYYHKTASIGDNVIKQGTLLVKYLEEGSNKELAPTETSTEDIDTNYSTKSKNFDKYELVNIEGQETGKYSNEVSEVVYYYKKKVETKIPVKIDGVENNKETAQVKTTTETKLPKTGDTIPYANYAIGLLFLALGVYIFKRE